MGPSMSIAGLAGEIDAAISAPVLVIGSVPPDARDLDLLARAPEYLRIAAHLGSLGFVPWRNKWATFDSTTAMSVQLFGAESWGLHRGHDELFEAARPVPGFRHLLTPAPHATLVLVAHSMLTSRGKLSGGGRRRAERAVQSDDGAWHDAQALAQRLGLSGALDMLRRALQQRDHWPPGRRIGEVARLVAASPPADRRSVARKVLPRRARPLVVSLSGPDGSGKSTQATLLRETLTALGVTSGGGWVPTTHRPPLPRKVRQFADRWRRPAPAHEATARQAPRPTTVPAHVRLAEHVWISTAAASNAAKLWRAVLRSPRIRVLVLDRFTLDADVKLTYWYALRRGADIALERRLFRAIAPRPDVAVLLAVRPETNYQRRADEGSLDAFRDYQRIYARTAEELHAEVVDAERPVAEVARDVARLVWARLP